MHTEFGTAYGKDPVAFGLEILRKGDLVDLWIIDHYIDLYGPGVFEREYGVTIEEYRALIQDVDRNQVWRLCVEDRDGTDLYVAGHWYNPEGALREAVRQFDESGIPHHKIIRIGPNGERVPCGSPDDFDMDD